MLDDLDSTNKELHVTKIRLQKTITDLKDLNIRKNEFISITSHELKTPLTSIRGFTQLLLKHGKKHTKDERMYMNIIDHEADRLNNIITEILDLSKLDLKTLKFIFVEINIRKLLNEISDTVGPRIKSEKLELQVKVGRGVRTAMIDRDRVMQVVLNFITNAIQFSPKEGVIILSAKKNKKYIRISVSDKGPGISADFHSKIFDRFYQVDSSYTRKIGGTGLGLAIAKELVEAMGGKVGLISSQGKGSTFYAELPLFPPMANEGSAKRVT